MRLIVAALLTLVLAAPAAAEPMPFDVLYEGSRYSLQRDRDVRAIETQAELDLFFARYADVAAPAVDFATRRVLAMAVQRRALCEMDLTVDRAPAASLDVVTLETHESSFCLTVLTVAIRVVSVPRFAGVAVFRNGTDPVEVYGYDVTA